MAEITITITVKTESPNDKVTFTIPATNQTYTAPENKASEKSQEAKVEQEKMDDLIDIREVPATTLLESLQKEKPKTIPSEENFKEEVE